MGGRMPVNHILVQPLQAADWNGQSATFANPTDTPENVKGSNRQPLKIDCSSTNPPSVTAQTNETKAACVEEAPNSAVEQREQCKKDERNNNVVLKKPEKENNCQEK